MKLILLRHATRSTGASFADADPPLNTIGRAQAEDFAGFPDQPQKKLPRPTQLITSPKLRAVETLAPLARALNLKAAVLTELDERQNDESSEAFQTRVKRAFELIKNRSAATDTIYVCSHLDFIEAAVAYWPTDLSTQQMGAAWSPLDYQVFEHDQKGLLKSLQRGRVERRDEKT